MKLMILKKIIIDSENILKKISEMNENYINKLIESNDIFMKRNNSLIEYCKGLLKFNEKYNKNYNLISTIRRISKNINNINQLKYENLINFLIDTIFLSLIESALYTSPNAPLLIHSPK